MNHTPGPWTYRSANGIFNANNKRIIALSYAGKAISQGVTYEELEANARLISKAPELIALVADIARHGYSENRETVADLTDRARVLLAEIQT